MGAERAQGGRGWVRIPASRGEQPSARAAAGGQPPRGSAGQPSRGSAGQPSRGAAGPSYGWRPPGHFGAGDQPSIYLSLVKRWREAGRTLPGHPDEEWERLISQPCWPGR